MTSYNLKIFLYFLLIFIYFKHSDNSLFVNFNLDNFKEKVPFLEMI